MIEINNLTKTFQDVTALSGITMTIPEDGVFGLIGTNGAGKSTLLKILAGILRETAGDVKLDGQSVFENPEIKKDIFYIPDDPYFFANASSREIAGFHETVYPDFQMETFDRLMKGFQLDPERKVNTFSKGMKKQLSLALGISVNTKYLLCDETFDGLDPVVRQTVKGLFAEEIDKRKLVPVIASHNLRELEDICEVVGLLHHGGVVFDADLEKLKLDIHKVQVVFPEDWDSVNFEHLNIVRKENRGRLYTLTVRGSEKEIRERIEAEHPVLYEVLPLSLEEIFIEETEVLGYDIRKLVLGE
ncbi:MAG: ABC transporter ATP-binding protein [Oribacterium sp.]|nr:ABC transporter ATP-binding protein [Oribacterium sp.]